MRIQPNGKKRPVHWVKTAISVDGGDWYDVLGDRAGIFSQIDDPDFWNKDYQANLRKLNDIMEPLYEILKDDGLLPTPDDKSFYITELVDRGLKYGALTPREFQWVRTFLSNEFMA